MEKAKKLTLTMLSAVTISQLVMSVSYAETATVITETLRLRKEPTTDSNILRNLDEGDVLEVLSKEGDWYKISFDGYEGYVAAEYIRLDQNIPSTTDENGETTDSNTGDDANAGDNASTNENEIRVKANTEVYILPALISSPLKTVENATAINILETINNWSSIEVEGIKGWVLNKNIENFDKIINTQTPDANSETNVTETKTGYVNVTSANIRAEASTDSEVVDMAVLNDEVQIIEDLGEWYKIKNGDGEAYIFANLVSDEKTEVTSRSSVNRTATPVSSEKSAALIASASGNSVAEFAKQYIGYGYVYGGSGPTSFDCSGFTMYVFQQFGINLPHNAVTQSNYGQYVSKDNLVPGDLVIFNDYSNTSIGHAGIYIGNGRIVHAENSNTGVTTDTIMSGYYDARFVEGRRLI